jgi:glycosyltransferase involved in cell wall biosynthesis
VRVLLDVSIFGDVYRDRDRPEMRTGIFRMVEQAATALAARPDVRLALCASRHRDDTLAFAATHPTFRECRFAGDGGTWAVDRMRRRLALLDARGRRPALPVRVRRRALRGIYTAARRVQAAAPALSPDTLAQADVFHSTLHALPTSPGPRTPRFQTLHDVIALVMPEVNWDGADALVRGIVDGVRDDDWVLAISQHTKNDFLELRPRFDPARVVVAHLAADPARFYPCMDPARRAAVRARYGVPDGPYLLSVSTLEPRKNLPHLLRTFAELVRAERVDDLHLVLTGAKGWGNDALDATLDGLGALRDRVVITGFVDDDDLAALYSGALAFVYPSLYEGFGLPPLEAMQCGVPVVTSNTSSLPEVVGDAGVLVDPRDGDALAQALLDLHRDGALRARLAARSLAQATRFTWERHAAATVAAYERAL